MPWYNMKGNDLLSLSPQTWKPSGLSVRALGLQTLGFKSQFFRFHPNLHLGLFMGKLERKS